jgi:hypothetical protein
MARPHLDTPLGQVSSSAVKLRACARLSLAALFFGGAVAAQTPAPEPASGEAATLACPMHLDVRAAAPGACPKCGMPLVPVAPPVPDDFDLRMRSTPAAPLPGRKVRLEFTIFHPKTGEQVREFGVLHEKLFHLFIVSQDMAEFQHIHPVFEKDGRFTIDTVLPRAGHYKVYADLYPLEGSPQVLERGLITAGYSGDLFASEPRLTPDVELGKVVHGMRIELALDPPHPIAGRGAALRYHLSDAATGAPIRDLVPYLGAWGHTLILSEDQRDYVHSHPVEIVPESREGEAPARGGPDVTFEAFLPRPGVYRIWSQFLRAGRAESEIATVSFTIRVRRLGES